LTTQLVLQATADVAAVDRSLQSVASTQSNAFFGDVYRSAQDDVLTDVIGRGWADFFVCSHDMVVVVEFVLPSFFLSFFLSARVFIWQRELQVSRRTNCRLYAWKCCCCCAKKNEW
jgi:hypothetical protein